MTARVAALAAIMVLLSLCWWPFCAVLEMAHVQTSMGALVAFCLACASGATAAALALVAGRHP